MKPDNQKPFFKTGLQNRFTIPSQNSHDYFEQNEFANSKEADSISVGFYRQSHLSVLMMLKIIYTFPLYIFNNFGQIYAEIYFFKKISLLYFLRLLHLL